MNQKMKDILRPTIKELRDMIFMLRKNALTMAAVIALILILVIALLAPRNCSLPAGYSRQNKPFGKIPAPFIGALIRNG